MFLLKLSVLPLDQVKDKYECYQNKRLTNNVIKTVVTSSKFECGLRCSQTDGCLAVNVIDNHNITCGLTTGISNENEMEDDSSSSVLVLSKYEHYCCYRLITLIEYLCEK